MTKQPEPIDHIVLMLVSGSSRDQIVASLGLDDRSQPLIDEARRRITLAADYNRVEQIGMAFTRLNEIYRSAAGDPKTQLAAQRELNKLLDLYSAVGAKPGAVDGPSGDADQLRAEVEAIRSHLLPLGLAPDAYPLREHARLAAERVRGA